MERAQFYKHLNIEQVQIADALDEQSFERWVNAGCSIGILNQAIENAQLNARRGQVPPGSAANLPPVRGEAGDLGLDQQPNRAPNQIDIELADDAMLKFMTRYPQLVPSHANANLIQKFLGSRNAVVNAKNLKIAYEALWGRLELREIVKLPNVDESTPAPVLRQTLSPGQGYAPFLFDAANAKAAAQAKEIAKSRPSGPLMKLIERVYTPAEVRAMSADQTNRFMNPITDFPQITSSADEYRCSEEFLADSPAYLTRSQREQTAAQISREVDIFVQAHPDYGKYCADEKFSGLQDVVLKQIDAWGLLVTASSLLDGFNWAAEQGFIPKLVDHADGQIATFKVNPDLNPPPTRTRANDIVYKGVKVGAMSSAALQAAINESPALRAALDAAV
jgi:hypothetical protein